MRIFGLTLVKNEGDILEQSMNDALTWCSKVAIVDNGSTDNTVEVITKLVNSHHGRIVYCGQEEVPFSNALRRIPFEALKAEAARGDWWCRLDADEFYPTDPRPVLRSVNPAEHVVFSIHLQYYYTDVDHARWLAGEETIADRARPIQQRRRYYRADHSEERFIRHRPGLVWQPGASWPTHKGLHSAIRMPVQHFKYRDPEQIQRRLRTRLEAHRDGHHNWAADNPEAWTDKIVQSAELHYDDHSGDYVVDPSTLPGNIEPLGHRVIKRVMHGLNIWP